MDCEDCRHLTVVGSIIPAPAHSTGFHDPDLYEALCNKTKQNKPPKKKKKKAKIRVFDILQSLSVKESFGYFDHINLINLVFISYYKPSIHLISLDCNLCLSIFINKNFKSHCGVY